MSFGEGNETGRVPAFVISL